MYGDAMLGVELAQLPQMSVPAVGEFDAGQAELTRVRDGVEAPGLRGGSD